jgi:MFS family permease
MNIQKESGRVRINTERTAGVSASTMAALMLAVFTVSVGFGVALPLLPYLIERLLGAGVEATQISRHTGLLTAVYTLSLFLFAPLWGRLSDRRGPRGVLLVGLLGFGASMLVFSFVESLTAVYAERFLSGLFAAAVTPVAAAVIGNFTTTEQGRARRLAFVTMAGIAGFLLGPMLSVFVTRFAADFFTLAVPAGSVAIPLAATALLAFLVASAVAFAVPRGESHDRSKKTMSASVDNTAWLVPKLLILTFIVSAGVGVFEVGLALRGKQELGLTPYQIALMFTECSLVMFVMQAIVFSPWFKPDSTRWLIAPALSVLAVGLFLVPWASDFTLTLVVIGAVAASAGILSPILTYWISAKAGSAQGWELGKQTAAASLGVTVGSAAGGLLFNVAALPGASFALTAGLAALGFLLSLGLPHLLVPLLPNEGGSNEPKGAAL